MHHSVEFTRTELVVTLTDGAQDRYAARSVHCELRKRLRQTERAIRDHADGPTLAESSHEDIEHRRHAEGAGAWNADGARLDMADDFRYSVLRVDMTTTSRPPMVRGGLMRFRALGQRARPADEAFPLHHSHDDVELPRANARRVRANRRRHAMAGKHSHRLDRAGAHGRADGGVPGQGRQPGERLEPHAGQGRAAGQAGRQDRRYAGGAGRLRCRVPDGLHRQGRRPGLLRQGRRRLRRQGQDAEDLRRLLLDLGRGIGRSAARASPSWAPS